MHTQDIAPSQNVTALPLTTQQRLDALHGRMARRDSIDKQIATGLSYCWQEARALHASVGVGSKGNLDAWTDEQMDKLDALAEAIAKLADTLRASAVSL